MAKKNLDVSIDPLNGMVAWEITFTGAAVITYGFRLYETDHITERRDARVIGSNSHGDRDSGMMPLPLSELIGGLGSFVLSVQAGQQEDFSFTIDFHQGSNVIGTLAISDTYVSNALLYDININFIQV